MDESHRREHAFIVHWFNFNCMMTEMSETPVCFLTPSLAATQQPDT